MYIDAANIVLSAKNLDFELDLSLLFNYLEDKYCDCRIVFFIKQRAYLRIMYLIQIKDRLENKKALIEHVTQQGLFCLIKFYQNEIRCQDVYILYIQTCDRDLCNIHKMISRNNE